jgi:drug/metabolite transporter (DMT)-like permease
VPVCFYFQEVIPMAFSPRQIAIAQALLVTFLWSTSWVIIKFGLEDIPPLVFAGLRYSLALACLLPVALRSGHLAPLRQLPGRRWALLALYGVLFMAVTQGAQFASLAYLPAITVSLLWNLTSIVVVFMGIALLAERPTGLQWSGVGLYTVGIFIYFVPVELPHSQLVGVLIAVIGVLANASSSVLGRHLNLNGALHPLAVTVVSMGFGSTLLLAVGIALQGWPSMSVTTWLYVLWLAVINTAFAFTLWNHTLRTLPAMESSLINSTMTVQIALLAWLFLSERPTLQETGGLLLVVIGVLLVQLRRWPRG